MRIKTRPEVYYGKGNQGKASQLQHEGQAGLLSEITTRLSKAKVNISAACAILVDDTAYFDMTTDSSAKAKKALKDLKLEFEEEDVIVVEMQNKIGELDKVAKTISGAGINIGLYVRHWHRQGRLRSVCSARRTTRRP